LNRFRSQRRGALSLIAVVVLGLVTSACGASGAYRKGQKDSDRGDWDLAVARFTRALAASPQNIRYKIALENAKIQASRVHAEKGRKLVQVGNLEKAMEEYGIAAGYDPSNRAARELAGRRPADVPLPVPLLSPRSPASIRLNMTGPLDKVYQTLGNLAGVNVVFDPDLQNPTKTITANISGVTFQEALDQIGLLNKKAYRILDRNTLLSNASGGTIR
jgi:general secretion pathway protein D